MFSRITIRTRLSTEQAADVVRELIRPEGFLGGLARAPNDFRPFIGRAKGDRFMFRRRLPWGWHNSFQPLVVGTVRPIAHGAEFDGTIRLHLAVMLLVPMMFLAVGVQALTDLYEFIRTSGAAGDYFLFAFLALFGGLAAVSYRYERRKAERILREAFERKGGTFAEGPSRGKGSVMTKSPRSSAGQANSA